MSQLDPLLAALLDKNARELHMQEGEPAAFLINDQLRPVTQKRIDRAQLARLLAELSDGIDAARLASGEAARFEYRSPEGARFDCQVRDHAGALRARVVPLTDEPEAVATPAAPAEAVAAETPSAPDTGAPVSCAAATDTVVEPARTVAAPGGEPEIEGLLRHLVEMGASDLHLSSAEVPMFRLHGEIVRGEGAGPISPEKMTRLLAPIIPERNRIEFEERNDTDFAHEIGGLARFRVNYFRDRHGMGAVFRVIPSEILTAEQLGLPPSVLDLCNLSKGLVLVTGPTGSGKSTTLAAMIDYINKSRSDHIITIEDPIEFVHENHKCLVNQREVVTHTHGFKPALRAALREDPDIVLVGELRDLETIAIAIETAETGHLVFGTLHTTTAISTVDRVIDQFPADRQAQIRTMLSESLKGVVSQILLKKIGGGRVAALEVLVVTAAISNLIREGKTFQIPSLMQTGRKLGMRLLNDALFELVKSGQVEPADAHLKAIDKSGLAGMFKSAGIALPGATAVTR